MKKLGIILLTVLMIFSMAACGDDNDVTTVNTVEKNQPTVTTEIASKASEEETVYPVTIKNYNRAKEEIEITVNKAPEKVFAVYQDSIETLLALGLEDRIVACAGLDQDVKEEYAEAFTKVNYLTEFSPDKETVLMLEPDFIVSWYSYFGEKKLGDVDFWHERNIGTYMMQNSGAAPERKLEHEYEDILNLGKIFQVEERAQAIVAEMKAEVEKVAVKVAEMKKKPTVLLMEFEKDGIRVYGENTLGGDMVKHLGAELVTAPENHMSSEDMIAINPDVIYTVYFGSSKSIADAEAAVSKLLNDPKFASLNAVKERRVHAISLGEMYCSGTRTLDGIIRLAKGIFPSLYE